MHSKNKDEYVGARVKIWMMKKEKEMKVPEKMMVEREEVDHEYVSLLCSIQVGSPSVSLWYVLWACLASSRGRRLVAEVWVRIPTEATLF